MICGTVVKSIAGRDKDRFYIVVASEGDRLWIANGKERKLSHPKKKNSKHLMETTSRIDLSTITSDKSLKKALTILDSID